VTDEVPGNLVYFNFPPIFRSRAEVELCGSWKGRNKSIFRVCYT